MSNEPSTTSPPTSLDEIFPVVGPQLASLDADIRRDAWEQVVSVYFNTMVWIANVQLGAPGAIRRQDVSGQDVANEVAFKIAARLRGDRKDPLTFPDVKCLKSYITNSIRRHVATLAKQGMRRREREVPPGPQGLANLCSVTGDSPSKYISRDYASIAGDRIRSEMVSRFGLLDTTLYERYEELIRGKDKYRPWQVLSTFAAQFVASNPEPITDKEKRKSVKPRSIEARLERIKSWLRSEAAGELGLSGP